MPGLGIFNVPVGGNAPTQAGQTHAQANPGQPQTPANPYLPQQPLPPPPQAPNIAAKRDPEVGGAQEKYQKWLDSIEAGTGRAMSQATSRTRDASEGIRTATREDAAFRGVPSAEAERNLDDSSARNIAMQHAAIGAEREKMIGEGTKERVAQEEREKSLLQGDTAQGLNAYTAYQGAMQAYNAQNAANSNSLFNQLQSVLNAKQSSGMTHQGGPEMTTPFYQPSGNTRGGASRSVRY